MTADGSLSHVLCPTPDLTASIAFYERAFGLSLRFRDGDKYAEFDRTDVRLALVAGAEAIAGGAVALGIAVPDLEATLSAVRSAGGVVVAEALRGPHELRAVVHDPAGNAVVVHAPLQQAAADTPGAPA